MKLPHITLPRGVFSTRSRTLVILVGLVLVSLSLFYTWRVSVDMKHEDEMAIEQLRRDERNAVEMWEDILHNTNIGGKSLIAVTLIIKSLSHSVS